MLWRTNCWWKPEKMGMRIILGPEIYDVKKEYAKSNSGFYTSAEKSLLATVQETWEMLCFSAYTQAVMSCGPDG